MQALVLALLAFIAEDSDFRHEPAVGMPAVVLVESREMAERILDHGPEASTPGGDASRLHRDVRGMYDPSTRQILLDRDLDLGTVAGRGYLVHELVHFLQYAEGRHLRALCHKLLERDAYRLQARYLRRYGVEPEFDEGVVVLRSDCWERGW